MQTDDNLYQSMAIYGNRWQWRKHCPSIFMDYRFYRLITMSSSIPIFRCRASRKKRKKQATEFNVHQISLVLFSLLSWISLKWNLKCIESITIKALFVCLFVLFAAVYDKHDYCPAWAARDECRKSNWTWMRDNCPLSCHIPREYLVHALYIFGQGEELITGQYTKQFTWSRENYLFKTFENRCNVYSSTFHSRANRSIT